MSETYTSPPLGEVVVTDGYLTRVRLLVPGRPVAKARGRGRLVWKEGEPTVGRPFKDKKTAAFEAAVASSLRVLLTAAPRGERRFVPSAALLVRVNAFWPRTQGRPNDVLPAFWETGRAIPKTTAPDVDNVFKAVTDAVNGVGVWLDDAQISCGYARTWWCAKDTRERITLDITLDPSGIVNPDDNPQRPLDLRTS